MSYLSDYDEGTKHWRYYTSMTSNPVKGPNYARLGLISAEESDNAASEFYKLRLELISTSEVYRDVISKFRKAKLEGASYYNFDIEEWVVINDLFSTLGAMNVWRRC